MEREAYDIKSNHEGIAGRTGFFMLAFNPSPSEPESHLPSIGILRPFDPRTAESLDTPYLEGSGPLARRVRQCSYEVLTRSVVLEQ